MHMNEKTLIQRLKFRDEKAFDYFLKAAELDYALAQYCVGLCYENGNGVNQNIFVAKRWYKKAAKNGDKEAEKALERLGGY